MKNRNSLNPFRDLLGTLWRESARNSLCPSFCSTHSSDGIASSYIHSRNDYYDILGPRHRLLKMRALSRLMTLITCPFLVLTFLSLCACSRKALVPRYSEELQGSQLSSGIVSIPTDWEIIDRGELQVLAKIFYESGGTPHSIYSVGIESCGMRHGTARQMALVRQLFSGFQQVQLGSATTSSWMPAEMTLTRVSAALDGKGMKCIVFSQFFQECLIEQAFWINSSSQWLHKEGTEKLLFSELKNLPPWSRYEAAQAQSIAEEEAP